MWLVGTGCSTAAGAGKKAFFSRLTEGQTNPISLGEAGIIKNKDSVLPDYKVHLRKDLSATLSHRERLNRKLKDAWDDLAVVPKGQRVGVILASTKGFIEDVVWDENSKSYDTLTPILEDFLAFTKLKPTRQAVVSNACSSVAAALKLAEAWFDAKSVDEIVVVSADTIGEFVVRGFHSLSALTPNTLATPFDQARSGLQLGEAAAVLLLSATAAGPLRLRAVGLNCEGVAATRPDEEGRSLYLALSEALRDQSKPTAVVAHGTGTNLNDSTEDFVFNAVFSDSSNPKITGNKWCMGHTLGVSAALDLISAQMILENGRLQGLANTKNVDAKLKGNYVLKTTSFSGDSVLVSSLGFGGVHAGLLLAKESP